MTIHSFTAALSLLFFVAQPVAAQPPAQTAAGAAASSPLYFNAALGFFLSPSAEWTLFTVTQAAGRSACGDPGRGTFCGQVATSGLSALLSVGGFVSHRVGLEIEAPFFRDRTGSGTYYYYGHSLDVRHHSTLTHSEQSLSVLVRFRFRPGAHSASIEPVVGWAFAHATDQMTNRVQSLYAWNSSVISTRPLSDVSRSQSAAGLSAGVDIVAFSKHRATFVVMTRGRWLGWPVVVVTSADSPDTIPSLVSHASLTVGAGIRWGGRQP